jgi:ABC-type glycerol-3-phosphate transport system substrate-binding protein
MKRHAISLLLIMSLLLASCGSDNSRGDGKQTTQTESVTDTEQVVKESLSVPEMNFDEREFVVLACDEDVRYTYFEITEQNGDIMDDAIYTRNRLTEEHLNIKLVVDNVTGTDTLTYVSKDIMSGDARYDMISPHILRSISQLVISDSVYDLGKLDYVNFSNSWWNSSFTETLKIKDKLFFASGDIIVPNARVIVFNKQMMEDYSLPDIYEVVNEGRWTLDMLGTYSKGAVRDVNGDSILDQNDYYAFSDLANTGLATSFVHGSNVLFVTKGKDGFELTLGNEKMHTIINKLYDYLYLEGNTNITNVHFGEGRVLFGSQVLLKLQILRDYKTDFGIIPFPKYDEAQDNYYSSVWNGLVCVPITAKDKSLCGAALETLAYYSQSTLMPAYYDKLLDAKFVRDEMSTKMLDIIFGGLVYDIGLCFDNFIGNYASIGVLLNEKSTDLASFYAQKKSIYETHYKEIYDAVKD